MNLSPILLLMLLTLLCCNACTPTASTAQQATSELPSRSELVRKFRQSHKMRIVYQAESQETNSEWKEILENARKSLPSWYTVEILSSDEATDSLIKNHPTLLIGTTAGHPWVEKVNSKLPISVIGEELVFDKHTFKDSLISLNLNFVPNPMNPSMPLSVITGLSDKAITQKLTAPAMTDFSNPLWSNYGYEIARQGDRILVGLFGDAWEYDEGSSWDFTNDNKIAVQRSFVSVKTHGFEIDDKLETALPKLIWQRWEQIQAFYDTTAELDPFVYHLYKDAELIGMKRRRMEQGFIDFGKKEVYAIHHPALKGQNFESFNGYLVQSLFGHELPTFMAEGLSHFFAYNWQKRGVLEWAVRLKQASALLGAGNLFDKEKYGKSSIYVRGATAGGLMYFLAKNHKDVLLKACREPKRAIQLIEPYYSAYTDYLQSQELDPASKMEHKITFHRGMTFAHEGYNVYDGYASHLGREALGKIANVNANCIAIVPYSGSRNTTQPVKYRLWEGAGGENSMSVVFAKYHAAETGMISLLKPQIYYGGAWPGAVQMQSDEDWALWHQYYKEWITHYALLAAMFDFEYFCVGVEFVHATLENPDRWRQLVQDMRKIYDGPITYATNWGEEAEKIAFADELDFIGVNCYYPLSEKENPTKEELMNGAHAINDKMQALYDRTKKPIVFTEAGFRSVARAWQNPHEEPKGRKVDDKAQLRCYGVMLEALNDQPWFKGVYWWKWPSYLGYSHAQPRSFTPCGKETEGLLREWYKKWESR